MAHLCRVAPQLPTQTAWLPVPMLFLVWVLSVIIEDNPQKPRILLFSCNRSVFLRHNPLSEKIHAIVIQFTNYAF